MVVKKECVGISAAILAGGKNSRMGAEKSLLVIRDEPIIDRMVALLAGLFSEVIISTSKISIKNRFPEKIFCEDLYREAGPLAGIHSVLKTASNDAVFVFACDMPELNPLLIQQMITHFKLSMKNTVLVPRHCDGIEPLHSVYHKNTIHLIEEQLNNHHYKINDFIKQANPEYYDINDEDKRFFFNINTKTDLDLIKRELING